MRFLVTVLVTLLKVSQRFHGSRIKDLQQFWCVYVSSDQKVAGSSPAGRTIQDQAVARFPPLSASSSPEPASDVECPRRPALPRGGQGVFGHHGNPGMDQVQRDASRPCRRDHDLPGKTREQRRGGILPGRGRRWVLQLHIRRKQEVFPVAGLHRTQEPGSQRRFVIGWPGHGAVSREHPGPALSRGWAAAGDVIPSTTSWLQLRIPHKVSRKRVAPCGGVVPPAMQDRQARPRMP